ncbi:MAG: hypothetical protein QOI58_1645 [Thermoanaerobaculia bacterium]|jgi:hypothetical protein|nr:hypothetical protein [Thermoanaerobaculia bacterium]
MLTIRPEQIEAIRAARDETLLREVAASLREAFPAVTEPLDDDALRGRLRELLGCVRQHGIDGEQDFARLANVAVALAWRYDAHPWLEQYLADSSVADPAERVRRVVSHGVREKERQEKNWRARRAFKGSPS